MKRDEDGAGHRHLRLQRIVLEELRALLRDDVSDPALFAVRITAVILSVDYRHARVHFAWPARAAGDRNVVDRALVRATPFLRARLADAIDAKRIPDLRFVFDAAAADLDASDDEEPS
jgi:ribosome-binding factor A